jgi:hypothetical protein
MRKFILLLGTGLLCLSFFSVAPDAGDLTILSTGNTSGEYKPCPS